MENGKDSIRSILTFGKSVNRASGENVGQTVSQAVPTVGGRLSFAHIALAFFLLFAVFARFYELGVKPLHHDESLFAYYSYFLARGFGYQYQPILHGPLLENVTALVFLLFGDSDFTMRLPAAVGSLGLFAALLGWRRYLGKNGTLVALALLAVSPSITYYSRFLRNDAPYLAATFWCAYTLLRAFETGEKRYFWYAGLAATIMFCMMESSIFFFAACVGYLGLAVLVDFFPFCSPSNSGDGRRFPGRAVFFAPVSSASDSSRSVKRELLTVTISALLGVGVSLLVSYFYVRVLSDSLPMPGWKRENGEWIPSLTQRVLEVLPLAALLCVPMCIFCGVHWHSPRGRTGTLYYVLRLCWHRRWTLLGVGAMAVIIYITLFTTWFTHTKGPDFFGKEVRWTPLQIYKNTWDYWWDQHQQHRIKGPFHYYLPILLLYELPALLLATYGGIRSLFERGRVRHFVVLLTPHVLLLLYAMVGGFANWDWNELDRKWHVTHPFHLALAVFYVQVLVYFCGVLITRARYVEAFLAFWTVTSLFAYSYAGEKVPWLSIHTAGPAILLASLYTGRWLDKRRLEGSKLAFALVIASLALLWQVRSLALAAWVHPASPAERIVYNHTTPDVVFAVKRIEELAHDSQYGAALPMYVKGEMEWPLYWYLRRYTNWGPNVQDELAETSRPVVLVNWESVADYPELIANYEIMRFKVREWWEPPLLDFTALSDIWRLFTPIESRQDTENGRRLQASLAEWRKLWRYIAYREIWLDPTSPGYSNGANEFAFCVNKKFLSQIRDYLWLTVQPMRRDVPVSQ